MPFLVYSPTTWEQGTRNGCGTRKTNQRVKNLCVTNEFYEETDKPMKLNRKSIKLNTLCWRRKKSAPPKMPSFALFLCWSNVPSYGRQRKYTCCAHTGSVLTINMTAYENDKMQHNTENEKSHRSTYFRCKRNFRQHFQR